MEAENATKTAISPAPPGGKESFPQKGTKAAAETCLVQSALIHIEKEGAVITELEFEQAIERYGDTVTRILLVRCGDVRDAEDCFQNVFLKLLTAGKRFHDEEHMKAWLIRTAINEAADLKRRAWRRRVTLLEELPDGWAASLPRDTVELTEAIRSLSPPLRDVLVLHCCEGCSVAETARILRLPEGTVKSRLSRARGALRDILKEEI